MSPISITYFNLEYPPPPNKKPPKTIHTRTHKLTDMQVILPGSFKPEMLVIFEEDYPMFHVKQNECSINQY